MGFFRRAGAAIGRVLAESSDPASAASEVRLYSKLVGGVTQLFARASNGSVYQITPPQGSVPIWSALYGWGYDGVLNFNGAPVTFYDGTTLSPVGSVYTLPDGRDINATTLTVAAGITLRPDGQTVSATRSITINGVIENSGNNGVGSSPAVASGAGSHFAGTSGGTFNQASGAINNGIVTIHTLLAANPGGGAASPGNVGGRCQGGSGGGGDLAAGFNAGAIGLYGDGATQVASISPYSLIAGVAPSVAAPRYQWGTGGGGGGSSSGAGAGSGAGGASGGCLWIAAPTISGSGRGSARGGNGGNASSNNAGGGGGGGGGVVFAFGRDITLALDAQGGTGGNGFGLGREGGNGGAGVVLALQIT